MLCTVRDVNQSSTGYHPSLRPGYLVAQLALVRARLNRILRQWYRLAPRQQLIIRHWIRSETIFTASSRSACTIPDSLSGLPLLPIFSQLFLI